MWLRSSGEGGCLSRNVAIAPSRKATVTSSSRTVAQNRSVLKLSTTAMEAPTHSVMLAMKAPPMWKIGMCSRCLAEAADDTHMFGLKVEKRRRYDATTHCDRQGVPDT